MSKAKEFIQEAEKLMDANDTLWLSFQANTTSDIAITSESFNTRIQTWKEELKKGNFVLPSFSANMRNSQQISSIAFQMTLNVRNKVLSSYKDIMNMPV